MSVERISGQGYAPIPQSMSNTDTEDEDERLAIENVMSHQDSDKIDNTESQGLNGWCHSTNDARNFGKDTADSQGGYRYCGDDVPIMVPEMETLNDFWKRRDMSTLRRCCLVFSIFLCFATVLVFLYVLPCDNGTICPPVVEKQPVIAWDNTLQGIELHGRISVVEGSPYGLIFLLRGQRFGGNGFTSVENGEIARDGGGVLSMQGNTGTLLWWVPLKKMPEDIDCENFDSVGSGTPDCIVIGRDVLVSIDPRAGISRWNTPVWTDSQLPLRFPDVDSDGIEDMILPFRFPYTRLIILSGRTGKPVSQYLDKDCLRYHPMLPNGFASTDNISYSCEKQDGSTKTVDLTMASGQLVEAKNLHFSNENQDITPDSSEIKRKPTSTLDSFENYTMQLTPYYQLNVENSGPCPGENCRVKINIVLEKDKSEERVIWEHTSNNSYVMKPALYPLDDKIYVTGFALKFWQWQDETETVDSFENIVKRRLSERIVMIFVNYTEVHELNASQQEIVQLCNDDDCQPSLKLQTRSLAIADLGNDGTWELVHYQSSYSPESPWLLTSKVRMVKLDTVLAQLTQTVVN